MARLAGRVAVVTGGGSGIGRAIGLRFAGEGARVVVADVKRDAAERVAAEIRETGGAALAAPLEVSDSAQVDALFARVVREWETVDILVNNAGIGELSPPLRAQIEQAVAGMLGGGPRRSLGVTSRMDDAEWRRMIDQMVLMRTPLGRSGAPEEIAAVALFLVSDDASFVTGQVVSPNGGLYC